MMLPHLVHLPKLGDPTIGFISVAEVVGAVPFEIKRIFWTYSTPETSVRGKHAHYQTQQVLVAVTGRIDVLTELPNGQAQSFVLDQPDMGVYIPPYCWRTMQYSQAAVQLVLASSSYSEADYIRSYDEFKRLQFP